ncbi:DUF488 domain-containing protein [bacterium]|nr:DUF488 domain-containing protein [bacterium]
MYYRRKILLALIESFGGRLQRTDCIKLLFLFCKKSGKQFYDFFPYYYGGFSFVAYQDKARLETLGLLAPKHEFYLTTRESFIGQLKEEDRIQLSGFTETWKEHLGKELVREAYLQYPYYAIRSKIADEVLTSKELGQIYQTYKPNEKTCLFSIGYEGKSIDGFLDDLIRNNIKSLIDVRKTPRSMKVGFSKTKLSQYLEKAGIQYLHYPELGIPCELRKFLKSNEDYQKLFKRYDLEILPLQTKALESVLNHLATKKRIALMCFEADPNHCHRSRILRHLTHAMDLKSRIEHV